MYISTFLLICALVYIFYLRKKEKELIELQKTIALLQEQILLFETISRRVSKLEKTGVSIKGLRELEDSDEDIQENKDDKEGLTVLSLAYFKGFSQLTEGIKKEIHTTREKIEKSGI
jgi:hypothetical protein